MATAKITVLEWYDGPLSGIFRDADEDYLFAALAADPQSGRCRFVYFKLALGLSESLTTAAVSGIDSLRFLDAWREAVESVVDVFLADASPAAGAVSMRRASEKDALDARKLEPPVVEAAMLDESASRWL